MAEKKWEDRLPLDDLGGFVLFGSALALRYLWRNPDNEEEPFSAHVTTWSAYTSQEFDKSFGLPIALSELANDDFPGLAETIHSALCGLTGRKVDLSKAADLQFSDFVFFAEDLWSRPFLTWFIAPKKSKYAPTADQETPISRNPEAPIKDLWELFHKWFRWHESPHSRADLIDYTFGHQPEHYHFMNYVAPVCEPPMKGRPHGSGYRDAANSAASYAWQLLHNAGKEGRELSISQAVRQSVSCFVVQWPSPELRETMTARDLAETILAVSEDQAEKRVRKLLDAIIKREPPWQIPPPLTPWDS